MKIKIKKFWEITFLHNTDENKEYKMIISARNVQKAVENAYKVIANGWSRVESNFIIKNIKQLEVNVNEYI